MGWGYILEKAEAVLVSSLLTLLQVSDARAVWWVMEIAFVNKAVHC